MASIHSGRTTPSNCGISIACQLVDEAAQRSSTHDAMRPIRVHDPEVTDGLPPAQRWRAMLAVAIAVAMSVLVTSIANIALPTIAHDMGVTPGRIDLGGERLSARGHRHAAAVRLDGRHLRPSPRLYLGPGGLHRGIARLRARAVAAGAGARPRAAGFRRRRHHERQRRAGALHLPARGARPRHRLQRAGGRRILRRRPVGRGGDHVGAVLALAVRAAGARRDCRPVAGAPLPAANAAGRPSVRSAERGAERDHLRPVHHRARRHRPRPGSSHRY